MGADLYIDKIFKENYRRNKRNFDRAVHARDSIFPRNYTSGNIFSEVDKIDKFVRARMNLPKRGFGDPMVLIPKNMILPEYIENVRDKYNRFVKAQERVSKYFNKMYEVGYFRDSYNGTCLLWRLGMSWWKCPYIKNDKISPEDAKNFLAEVQSKKIDPITIEELKKNHCSVDDGENSVDSWNKYFLKKKEEFCAFLQEAIDKGFSIRASV